MLSLNNTNFLSADELAKLRALFSSAPWAAMTDAERFARINAPAMAPNPRPQGQVAVPFTATDIIGLLSPASAKAVAEHPNAKMILAAWDNGNTQGVGQWSTLLAKAGTITTAEATTIAARASQKKPDPNWQAQLPTGPPAYVAALGLPGRKTWKNTWVDAAKRTQTRTTTQITLDDVALARTPAPATPPAGPAASVSPVPATPAATPAKGA